ncbi:hypothetical protein [Tanticharoenia sakaeratensis]|uniref:Uncharacterized protein n=1 Tax=Tanticharoenia sakaeratensis NBRC 103193 TaxID=1231623 RepID=A0A0D6MME0_9PROT|nr:hypothetical protein [Tanticharoenia sakaeratensis]GAN54839.1 hypothetical protein Tasa_031_057 [Tanticharoenia sakaeratensis NBRC 103193]GBQ21402.1 hypothetical protein AA103193_1716 [Tanticharoenia sakaeratensis NBRC 103193]
MDAATYLQTVIAGIAHHAGNDTRNAVTVPQDAEIDVATNAVSLPCHAEIDVNSDGRSILATGGNPGFFPQSLKALADNIALPFAPSEDVKAGRLKIEDRGKETLNTESPPEIHRSLIPVSMPSEPKTAKKAKTTSKPEPSHYTQHERLEDLLHIFDSLAQTGQPFNQLICYKLTETDEPIDLDRRIRKLILDQLRDVGVTDPCAAGMAENDFKGGEGLHRHVGLHIPKSDFAVVTQGIESALAKRYAKRLRKLATIKGLRFKTRETAVSLYRRLAATYPKDVPFWIAGREPIGTHEMRIRLGRYVSKSIDPDHIITLPNGVSRTVESFGDRVALQKQAAGRPKNPVWISKGARRVAATVSLARDQQAILNSMLMDRIIDKTYRECSVLLKEIRRSQQSRQTMPPDPVNIVYPPLFFIEE